MPSHRLDILEGGQASLNKLQKINSGLSVSVEKDKGVGVGVSLFSDKTQLSLKTQFPGAITTKQISATSHLILQADKIHHVSTPYCVLRGPSKVSR